MNSDELHFQRCPSDRCKADGHMVQDPLPGTEPVISLIWIDPFGPALSACGATIPRETSPEASLDCPRGTLVCQALCRMMCMRNALPRSA
jgi:hypothetical protein